MMITADILDAVKVQFLEPIFEDDFVERGMKAWLTGVEWEQRTGCYKLFFDFSEFEAENEKYFRETYFANIHTANLPPKSYYTAKEIGNYNPKYCTHFSADNTEVRNDSAFADSITKYLRIVP